MRSTGWNRSVFCWLLCSTCLCLSRHCVAYVGTAKTALRLDCYLGFGFRTGSCGSSNDIRNHELRLGNLENAGYKNHQYTRKVGDQVVTLKKIAGHHQFLHESTAKDTSAKRTLSQSETQNLKRARQLLQQFPSAKVSKVNAENAWRRVFKERILKPITAVDWLQILLAVVLVMAISFKTYLCVKKRKRGGASVVNIHQPPTAYTV